MTFHASEARLEKLTVCQCPCGASVSLLDRDPLPPGWSVVVSTSRSPKRADLRQWQRPERGRSYEYRCPRCRE